MQNTPISFTGTPTPTQQPQHQIITSDPFFPSINLDHMRQAMRIDNTITSERLFQAAIEATIHVNLQLATLKKHCQLTGKNTLAEHAPQQQINGISIWEHRYQQAVYNYTLATLNDQYADYDASGKATARSETKQHNADQYRRSAHAAIADITGKQRTDAELI